MTQEHVANVDLNRYQSKTVFSVLLSPPSSPAPDMPS
jgi:hypothetical protein